MRDYRDAKAMAQTLRQALKEKSVVLTHGESLELVARILGCADWNVLSARIQAGPASSAPLAVGPSSMRLPVVPSRDVVFFPQMTAPLYIGRMKSTFAVDRAMTADRQIFLVTQRRSADDDPQSADLYDVGVIAYIMQAQKLPDGSIKLMVHALSRARIIHVDADKRCLTAELSLIQEDGAVEKEAETLAHEVRRRFESYANVSLSSPPQALLYLAYTHGPGRVADSIAQYLSATIEQRQELLQTVSIVGRLKRILTMMDTDRKAA